MGKFTAQVGILFVLFVGLSARPQQKPFTIASGNGYSVTGQLGGNQHTVNGQVDLHTKPGIGATLGGSWTVGSNPRPNFGVNYQPKPSAPKVNLSYAPGPAGGQWGLGATWTFG